MFRDIFAVEGKHAEYILSDSSQGLLLLSRQSLSIMEKLEYILRKLYANEKKYFNDYCMILGKEIFTKSKENEINEKISPSQSQKRESFSLQTDWNYTLSFECLSPNVAFDHLSDSRSIILASGTLSPLDSFSSELGVKFESQLTARHVVDSSNINALVIGKSENDFLFQGTYKNLQGFKYQDELGNTILDILKVVDNGILLFLPSYFFINSAFKRWEATGLLSQMRDLKDIITEPQSGKSEEFDELISKYKCSAQTKSGNDNLILSLIRLF